MLSLNLLTQRNFDLLTSYDVLCAARRWTRQQTKGGQKSKVYKVTFKLPKDGAVGQYEATSMTIGGAVRP
jgi:hypothetical protein